MSEKKWLMGVLLSLIAPICVAAQAPGEDPAVLQRREEIKKEIQARLEVDRAFFKSLEGKNPSEREAAIKARHEKDRPADPVDPAVLQRREEIKKEIQARLEADRAFFKSLEGKTPSEREAAIKARHEKDRPADPVDPAVLQRREEIKKEIQARLEADRAFFKSLEGKTPAEREAAIKARRLN